MPNKRRVTWEEVEAFIEHVCMLHKDEKPSGVYGLPRGGLVPAVMLSYRMGVPLLMAPTKGCIVVDDIADTGETLLHYKSGAYSTYEVVTMFYREGSLVKPDYYFAKKEGEWIQFPWEEKE